MYEDRSGEFVCGSWALTVNWTRMGRSSRLGSTVNSVCLLSSQPVANQFREIFREMQDRLKNKNKQD